MTVPSSRIDENTLVSRDDRSIWRVVDGRTVCLTLDGEYMVHEFNETATRIWSLLEEPRSVGDIARSICEEYDAPLDRIEKDIAAFLPTLQETGLICVVERAKEPVLDGEM